MKTVQRPIGEVMAVQLADKKNEEPKKKGIGGRDD
jgi:hypothetical protein